MLQRGHVVAIVPCGKIDNEEIFPEKSLAEEDRPIKEKSKEHIDSGGCPCANPAVQPDRRGVRHGGLAEKLVMEQTFVSCA